MNVDKLNVQTTEHETNNNTFLMANNGTNQNYTETYQYLWMCSQAIIPLNFLFCLWVFISLWRFGITSGKLRNKKKKSVFLMTLISMILPIVVGFKVILTQSILVLGRISFTDHNKGNNFCENLMDVSTYMYCASVLTTYSFYWVRQRILYSKKSIQYLNTTFVKCFRVFALLFMVFGVIIATLYTKENRYVLLEHGCAKNFEANKNVLYDYLAISTMVISQVILFCLFIYPLCYLKQQSKRNINKATSATKERLENALNTVTKGFLLGVASDLVSLSITLFNLPHTVPRESLLTVYDVGLCVSVLSIVLASGKIKKILLFCNTKSLGTSHKKTSVIKNYTHSGSTNINRT